MGQKKRKRKVAKEYGTAAIAVALIVVIMLIAHSCHSDKDIISTEATEVSETTEKNPKMYSWTEEQNQENLENYDWVDQTTYDPVDDKNLSSELFAIPFAMSDTYVTNNRLTEVIGEKEESRYVEGAKSYIMSMLNHSYRDILSDQEGFKSTLDNYWYGTANLCNEFDTQESTEDVADSSDALMQWFIDNKVVMSCEIATDTCMMFQDNYRYYVRAEVALTLHGGKNAVKEFKKLYNMDLKDNGTAYYIMEIESIPSAPDKITAFNVLMEAKSQ